MVKNVFTKQSKAEKVWIKWIYLNIQEKNKKILK